MTIATREPHRNRGVGRPRSAESHQAILRATLELIAEEGIQGASIEAIAARAGVGKTTIYRRWSSKEALIVDALNELHPLVKLVDTGNLHKDLTALLREILQHVQQESTPLLGKLLFRVLGEAKSHPEFLQALHDRLYAPRLQQLDRFIHQAQIRGELRQDLDSIFVASLLAGPLLYYLLVSQAVPVLDPADDLPERVVDTVLHGAGIHA